MKATHMMNETPDLFKRQRKGRKTNMTHDDVAMTYLRHHPEALSLTSKALHSSVSHYVTTSYLNAVAAVAARRALGFSPRDEEIAEKEVLAPYLRNVSPIVKVIRPDDGNDESRVSDPANMNMDEYSSWRNQGNSYDNRVSAYHTGRGMFDQ
jgi:hypothetical protein